MLGLAFSQAFIFPSTQPPIKLNIKTFFLSYQATGQQVQCEQWCQDIARLKRTYYSLVGPVLHKIKDQVNSTINLHLNKNKTFFQGTQAPSNLLVRRY